jgi:hypothetical protein
MKKSTIPVIFSLILLLTGAFVGVLFLGDDVGFLPRAAPEYLPENIRVTNVSDTGFTVSWTTKEPTIGFLRVGTIQDKLNLTFVDDRDQLSGNNESFRTHHISAYNLEPNTTYYYTIGSHNQTSYDNAGTPYQVVTAPLVTQPPESNTLAGTVLTPVQTPASGAMIYFSTSKTAPLSAIANSSGSFAFNLSLLKSSDLKSSITLEKSVSLLDFEIQDGVNSITKSSQTFNSSQLSPLVIGDSQNPLPSISQPSTVVVPTASTSAIIQDTPPAESKFNLSEIEVVNSSDNQVLIESLPPEGGVTNDTQPTFSGKAPSNKTLTITVHSENDYFDTITTDESGEWSWQPPGDLEPGSHQVEVSYIDEAGVVQVYSREFVVASASEESGSPTYVASPSAVISPTSTPSPTVVNVPTPTSRLLPTPTIRSSMPATDSAIPVSGSTTTSIVLITAGMMLVSFGILLIKVKRI